MKALGWALAGLAAAAAAVAAQAACPPPPAGAQVIGAGPLQAVWRAEPDPIVVGRPFALLLTLCPAEAVLQRVDASMPEHRHGMNYRPSLKALGEGRWRAEGLLWHMSGRWELQLDVQLQGIEHRLRQSVELP